MPLCFREQFYFGNQGDREALTNSVYTTRVYRKNTFDTSLLAGQHKQPARTCQKKPRIFSPGRERKSLEETKDRRLSHSTNDSLRLYASRRNRVRSYSLAGERKKKDDNPRYQRLSQLCRFVDAKTLPSRRGELNVGNTRAFHFLYLYNTYRRTLIRNVVYPRALKEL